ncbi:beta-N-acetylhexosaminidase [Biformimicrobium ophioploci]|uniref:Beta-hexosaminidase n=1 Tax=Biformimicrobium ophioploci TaxID=3036711 RepID=A0ABQ6M1K3_9GAMM|nr:beta-N-acetylhexosaminidase [Microbulbifer sp. NKW57]GMG88167.1 beta-N-acetylhexosaminidase [Microbulbifer sp. NKW57]
MTSKLGQVMIDIAGQELDAEDRQLLRHPQVGGLIFFARNYSDRAQLQQLVQDIRSVRPGILLAVDQEGGRVQRFREEFTRLPSMQALSEHAAADQDPAQRLADVGWLMAAELLASGIDFSFAPVLDADSNQSRVIGDRSFSPDPAAVSERVSPFIAGMHEAGMSTTGKHFPGHGFVVEDSHVELPVDDRTLEQVLCRDCQPFTALMAAGSLEAVMPAHIRFPKVDGAAVGFSRYWLQDILRARLGFDGVIFSDDLSMEGASVGGDYGGRIHAALDAGCDMGIVCNNREGAVAILDALQGREVSAESAARLEAMRGRPAVANWDALMAHPRWRATREWLSGWMPV